MSANKAKLQALLGLINSATQDAIAEYEKAGGDVPSIDSTELHPLDDTFDQVALRAALRTLEGACAQLCTTLAPPAHTAINLVQVYDYACVRVALRENITDVLSGYPKGIHINELSKIVGIEAKKLARLLRILVTRGCYTEVDTDTFANNRLSLMLHSEHPVCCMISSHVESDRKGVSMLYESLKDPRTASSDSPADAPAMYANNMKGTTLFDRMNREDALGELESYHRSMAGLNYITGSLAVLTQFLFEKYSTVVDVGGGIGAISRPLSKMHGNVKITVHDLPEALAQARSVWARECPDAIQENRVEFVELNFFTDVPVKGKDIYYLRNIIHDWPDHESVLILKNVRRAMEPHSRVLIHDVVLRELSRKQAAVDSASFGVVMAPEPLLPNFGVGSIRMYQQDMMMWILHNAKEPDLKLEKVWDLAETCVLEFSAA